MKDGTINFVMEYKDWLKTIQSFSNMELEDKLQIPDLQIEIFLDFIKGNESMEDCYENIDELWEELVIDIDMLTPEGLGVINKAFEKAIKYYGPKVREVDLLPDISVTRHTAKLIYGFVSSERK